MIDLYTVMQMPTVQANFHESTMRSYHILAYMKSLLQRGTPPDVVLEIIESLERPAGTRLQAFDGDTR